jgi:hypothetical protein
VLPRPRVTNVGRAGPAERARRWARDLRKLPARQAILRVRDGDAAPIRIVVAPVPDMTLAEHAAVAEFAREALTRRGRSITDAGGEMRERLNTISSLSNPRGMASPPISPSTGQTPPVAETPERSRKADAPGWVATPPNKERRTRRVSPLSVGRIAEDGSIA